ncbi:MAG: type VI secretion system tip protein VgrG [Bacteroidetes bacterium]|nr:type VI secretion system tip protein VgrG [Bacteroidota bacterium]
MSAEQFTLQDSSGNALGASYAVLEFHIWKQAGFIAKARLVISDGSVADADFSVSNEETFAPGAEITILGGTSDEPHVLFKGIVVRHGISMSSNRPGNLELELRDKAVKMTDGRKSKVFADAKDSDIFDELTSPYSLTTSSDATAVTHKEIVQFDCTDWDFLLARADANGLWVINSDGELQISKPDPGQSSVLTCTFGGNTYEFEAEIDARDQYTSVAAKAWNPASQELQSLDAAAPSLPAQGNLDSDTLAGTMGLSDWSVIHGGARSDSELQAWADAMKYKSALARIKGRLEIDGNKDLLPGKLIELNGFGNRFNGNTLITGIYHHFTNVTGWHTEVSFGMDKDPALNRYDDYMQKPASSLLPAINGLQIGVVESLSGDEDGEFRIKVKVPVMGSTEPVFARVVMTDAGNARGTFLFPEVGDEVVLGFLNDDPRDAILLGRLYSSSNSPAADFALDDDNNIKGFVSREGIKILVDDAKKCVDVETPAGKKITMDEEAGTILIQDENNNKIELGSSGITIESGGDIGIKATGNVKIEGVNINAEASAQMTAKGSASAEFSSSGTNTIKGAMVQIN